MIRFMIVDDEPIAHKVIESFAQEIPYLELQTNCYNAMEAMEFLHTHSVDLIFLDINMPKVKGLDFLRLLQNPPSVIITSAYQEFALEGYELEVTDYLLKPFSLERFLKAIQRVSTKIESQEKEVAKSIQKESSIFLKGDKKYHQVKLDDILVIESLGSYCKVITLEETIITHKKISNFEAQLPSEQFLRTHKSYMIAKSHIKSIEGNRILISGTYIPIGQTYKSDVKRKLKL